MDELFECIWLVWKQKCENKGFGKKNTSIFHVFNVLKVCLVVDLVDVWE